MKMYTRVCTTLAFVLCSLPVSSQESADVAAIHSLLNRIERVFVSADLDAAMTVFTDDAVILSDDGPDIVGATAIREAYAAMLGQFEVTPVFTNTELVIAGDMAYEKGTYTMKLVDRASSQVVADTNSRYVHIFKRQRDGSWKTWRLMTNSFSPASAP